jgi:hypothetical protein
MAKKDVTDLRDKRKEDQRRADDRFTKRVLGVMVFLAVWTFLLYRFSWHTAVYALPAGLAILYLLAYIYPKDFIALSLLVAGGAFGLWGLSILGSYSGRWDMLAHIIFAAAILLSFIIILFLKRKNGVVSIGSKAFTVIPRKGHYTFLFIGCGALTAALIAAALFGSPAALVSMAAMFCYLFISAVYYTVRLI